MNDDIIPDDDDDFGLSHSLKYASELNAQQHAEDLLLSENTMLPMNVVKGNRDQIKQNERSAYYDAKEMLQNSPKTGVFLSEPDNAAVALDYIPSLRGLERNIDIMESDILSNSMANVGNRINTLTGNLLQIVGHGGDTIEEAMTSITGINPGLEFGEDGVSWSWNLNPDTTDGQFLGRAISEGKGYKYTPNFTWEKFKDDMTVGNLADMLLEQGAPSAVDMAAAMFVLPAYIASRTQEMGESRMTNLGQEGVDPTWDELGKAFIPAVLTSVTEKLATKYIVSPKGAKNLKDIGKATAHGVMVQGGSEFFQEGGIEYLGETLGTNKDLSLNEALDRGLAGMVIGGGVGGTLSFASSTYEAINNRSALKVNSILQSALDQQNIDALIQYAQSDNLSQISSETHRKFLQEFKDQSLYVDADIVNRLGTPSEYLDALVNESGTDVEIPLDVFITEVAPDIDLMAELRPHVKLKPDSSSAFDIESGDNEHSRAINKLLRDAASQSQIKDEADDIFEKVSEQLVETGRMSKETANITSSIYPAYVTTYVERARKKGHDITVKEVYDKMGLTIIGPNDDLEQSLQPDKYSARQQFGDIQYTQAIIERETGDEIEVVRSAQDAWGDIQARKSNLQELVRCLNG